MIIKHDGWEFTRQLGVGEREHVRTLLLGVAFFSQTQLVDQLRGAVAAADTLGMLLRAHVNFSKLDEKTRAAVYMYFRDEAARHQLENWQNLGRSGFDEMCRKLEVMVVEGPYASDAKEAVQIGLLKVWSMSGGRFLEGNFAMRTDAELRHMYPDMYHSTDRFWEAWN